MGSFNIQCFASRQTIAEHDPCRVAVIVQSNTFNPVKMATDGREHSLYGANNHVSSPDAFWKPMTAFLEARYSDYATLEPVDSTYNRAILASLFTELLRQAASVQVGQNASHEPAFDFKALVARLAPRLSESFAGLKHFLADLKPQDLVFSEVIEVWKALEEAIFLNRVFITKNTESPRPVKLAVVHETAYRNLISTAEGSWAGSGLSYERHAFFGQFLGELREELATIEDHDKRYFRKDRARELFKLRMADCGQGNMLWPFSVQLHATTDELFDRDGTLDRFLQANKDLLDSIYALKGLNWLRIPFSPFISVGQDYDNSAGQLYAAFISFTERQVSKDRSARDRD